MPVTLAELVSNLTERPLPALAITSHNVKKLLDDQNTSNLDLQVAIAHDPGLTVEIYRRFAIVAGKKRGPASDIAHAISMLGPIPVKTAIGDLPIVNSSRVNGADDGTLNCYSRAIHAAGYAHKLGEILKDKNPEQMAQAALLLSCGEMALWKYAGKAMKKVQGLVKKGIDYGKASSSVLGFTLDQLSLELAKAWSLHPLLEETLDSRWHNNKRLMAIVLADSLAKESANGWHNTETTDLIEHLAETNRITKNRMTSILHHVAVEIGHSLEGYPLPFSAYNLLLEKPKTVSEPTLAELKQQLSRKKKKKPAPQRPKQEAAPTPRATTEGLKTKPTDKPAASKKPAVNTVIENKPIQPAKAKATAEKTQAAKPITDKPAKEATKTAPEAISKPVAPEPEQKPAVAIKKEEPEKITKKQVQVPEPESRPAKAAQDKNERQKPREVKPKKAIIPSVWKGEISDALRKIRRELGLRRIMFVKLSEDKRHAVVGHLLGADVYSRLNVFSVDLQKKNLFSLLLSKQQGFWLTPENSEKFLPLIPKEVLESIDKRGFFCMSVFVKNKPVGLVYSDGREAMNEDNYAQFKQMCLKLGTRLEQKK